MTQPEAMVELLIGRTAQSAGKEDFPRVVSANIVTILKENLTCYIQLLNLQ